MILEDDFYKIRMDIGDASNSCLGKNTMKSIISSITFLVSFIASTYRFTLVNKVFPSYLLYML